MTPKFQFRKVSIQTYIAALFMGLGLVIGVATTALGYAEAKNLSVTDAFRIFGGYAEGVGTAVRESRNLIATNLDFVAGDAIVAAPSLEARLKQLPIFAQALREAPQLTAIYVGYTNGDFILLRNIRTQRDRATYQAAPNAKYLVQSVERPKGTGVVGKFISMDGDLRVIKTRVEQTYDFDPRSRPWFEAAKREVQSMPPYIFYLSHEIGITLTKKAANGSVAGADVDLEFVSTILQQNKPTRSTLAAIVDQDGSVVAFSDPSVLIGLNNGLQQTHLAGVGRFGPELAEAFRRAADSETLQGAFPDSSGKPWLYEVAYPNRTLAGLRRVYIVVPEDDLLGPARAIRNRLLIVSIALIAAWLPIAWWATRLVSRPLRRLDQEAASIQKLDFSDRPHQASAIKEIEQLSTTFDAMRHRVREYNRAASRFVPFEFLNQLSREDIIAVELGDHVEREMTVLFADIRSFTTLSEQMSPQENFDFLNAYLGDVGPIVRHHGGFVDKYIGDAVMALFPQGPEGAVSAAVAIQRQVDTFNEVRPVELPDRLTIGIGIHSGALMLGTIGEKQRFETTVIADVVNVASRIESLTKTIGSRILVSGQIIERLDLSKHHIRRICDVQVKGTTRPTTLFEIFDADPPDLIAHKVATSIRFEKGRRHFAEGRFSEAAAIFFEIAAAAPRDGAALWLGARSEQNTVSHSAEWQGVELLDFK